MKRLVVRVGAFALLLGLAVPAQAQAARTYTIRTQHATNSLFPGYVSRIGDFRPGRNPTIAAAQRVFGKPIRRHLSRYGTCTVRWHRPLLTIYFENYGGVAPGSGETTCTPRVGQAQSFVARGRRFETRRGLHVGDSRDTLLELYPSADHRKGGWWLDTAVSPFGDQSEYAVLLARMSNGRVSEFQGLIGAAGE